MYLKSILNTTQACNDKLILSTGLELLIFRGHLSPVQYKSNTRPQYTAAQIEIKLFFNFYSRYIENTFPD